MLLRRRVRAVLFFLCAGVALVWAPGAWLSPDGDPRARDAGDFGAAILAPTFHHSESPTRVERSREAEEVALDAARAPVPETSEVPGTASAPWVLLFVPLLRRLEVGGALQPPSFLRPSAPRRAPPA